MSVSTNSNTSTTANAIAGTIAGTIGIRIVDRDESQAKYSVKDIAMHFPPPSWRETFIRAEKEITHLNDVLSQIQIYYPPKLRIFRALDMCPLELVKVVIIGQDPYPQADKGIPYANGLSFSTDRGLPVPSSLQNIYKEIHRESLEVREKNPPGPNQPQQNFNQNGACHLVGTNCPEFIIPMHGDLREWAQQGVLLLNTTLTVAPNKPNSHRQYSIGFAARVLETLLNTRRQIIFMLWGREAQSFTDMIGNKNVLLATHPSGLSAYRDSKTAVAFSKCDHFKIANELLVARGSAPINWQITPT